MTTKQSKLVRDIFSRLSWVEVMLLRELAWITWWRKDWKMEGRYGSCEWAGQVISKYLWLFFEWNMAGFLIHHFGVGEF
jgi:hypothetical protein